MRPAGARCRGTFVCSPATDPTSCFRTAGLASRMSVKGRQCEFGALNSSHRPCQPSPLRTSACGICPSNLASSLATMGSATAISAASGDVTCLLFAPVGLSIKLNRAARTADSQRWTSVRRNALKVFARGHGKSCEVRQVVSFTHCNEASAGSVDALRGAARVGSHCAQAFAAVSLASCSN